MASEIICIKGIKNGLLICLDSSRDIEELKANLKAKIESAKGFFSGARFAFHFSAQPLSSSEQQELRQICCQHGLIPDDNIQMPQRTSPSSGIKHTSQAIPVSRGVLEEEMEQATMLVEHSVRSGQKVQFDGNVVILGDVNPGAEIIASGHIVVMGSLRGIAHAGLGGFEEATIMAYNLQPTQLRIANKIARAPEQELRRRSYPEIAYISHGQIVIERYRPSRPLAKSG
ncbi:septum site-determining protein MinC [Calderihabitans maritimus]|uniref:Probable septum site-determining protein MinC n=1 Tax=Calderihabitans maritimus TaxID=1246530 RepID=A0A1Z5HPE2_9FIRM|nr:septum site-determining protein MinC [Calderihabitans maritimus]GAW91165.1 septum site-determining protein minC [Calderihabitans maritimus]